jgi:thiol-disulfide isomerase/thioredoxin
MKHRLRTAGMFLLIHCSLLTTQALALEVGDTAPSLSLPSIFADQAAIDLDALRGKTVYVDFWASWCAPCLRSMPAYNELSNRLKGEDFEFVAINVDNPIEDGLDFLIDEPLDFLIPSDPDGEAAELFGVIGMPTSYLIDPEGTIRLVHMGFRDGDMEEIEAAIKELIAD